MLLDDKNIAKRHARSLSAKTIDDVIVIADEYLKSQDIVFHCRRHCYYKVQRVTGMMELQHADHFFEALVLLILTTITTQINATFSLRLFVRYCTTLNFLFQPQAIIDDTHQFF